MVELQSNVLRWKVGKVRLGFKDTLGAKSMQVAHLCLGLVQRCPLVLAGTDCSDGRWDKGKVVQ